MDQEVEPIYRNRQTLIGLVVRPRQQMRAALVFIVGTWIVLGVLLWALLKYPLSEGEIIWAVVSAAAVLTVFALLTGIVLSHKLFGPLISIKRHIAALREGQYSARLQIRRDDDLGEMRDALNDLAEALENRHGPGRTPS